MNTKNKYPWLRHIDFLVVDLLALLLSFTLAFFIKFEGVWVISSEPDWTSSVWARLVLLFSAADVVYTLLLTPYNGIFKRKYYMEVFHALQLAALNAISVALVLYSLNSG